MRTTQWAFIGVAAVVVGSFVFARKKGLIGGFRIEEPAFAFNGEIPSSTPTPTNLSELAGEALSRKTGNDAFKKAGDLIGKLFSGPSQDNLVSGYQDPLVHEYFAQIVDAWNAAVASGQADESTRAQVKQLIKTAAAQFYAEAASGRHPSTGAGGIATIRNFVDGTLIPSIDRVAL